MKGNGSAYWRIGVWGSKTAFRHGHIDQEVSMALMTRRYASPSRPVCKATLRAAGRTLNNLRSVFAKR